MAMTFEEAMIHWAAREVGRPVDDIRSADIEHHIESGCPTCMGEYVVFKVYVFFTDRTHHQVAVDFDSIMRDLIEISQQ